MRKEERFCESCGYYNGEKDNSSWDDNYDDHNLFDDYEVEEKEEGNEEFEEFNLKDSSGTKKNEFSYENEDLLEAFIGEDYKPLIKIASGGEMSRIMLGIKKVLADIDNVPILIFDEIDTGISGIAANRVGQKMKEISKYHQVISITHLAQIAAKGDFNYFIHKEVEGKKTNTKIEELTEDDLIKELARIATGEINNISIEHAKELRSKKVA